MKKEGEEDVYIKPSMKPLEITGGLGTLVSNFLNPQECTDIIALCEEAGWGSIAKEYPENYRNNKRRVFKSASLAANIWKRLNEVHIPELFNGIRPFGFGNEGEWIPIGLNDCFKACKYYPGGAFRPHYDGVFVKNEDERSAVTVMIYLNDDFEGGGTNFLQKKENAKLESYASNNNDKEEKNVIMKSYTPQKGSAVVFTHDVLHEGAPVIEGIKYILRTEIMFQRISGKSNDYKWQPNYTQALRLYEMSDILEAEGDAYGSTICYLKALDLQEPHKSIPPPSPSSPSLSLSSFNNNNNEHCTIDSFPQDVLALIFSYISPSLIFSLSRVCKKWKQISSEDWLWRRLFTHRWPLFHSHPLPLSPLSPSFQNKPKKERRESTDEGTWNYRQCYASQMISKTPVVIINTVSKTQAGNAGQKTPDYFNHSTVIDTIFQYHCNIVGRGLGDLWNRYSAFEKYSAASIGELNAVSVFYMDAENKTDEFENLAKVWVALFVELVMGKEVIELARNDEFEEMKLEGTLQDHSRPLMMVDYVWPDQSLSLIREIAFEILRVPSFCMHTFGALALYALNESDGIVIDFGISFDSELQKVAFTNCYNLRHEENELIPTSRDSPQHIMIEIWGGSKRVLSNIVLVGSHPLPPHSLLPVIKKEFPDYEVNVSAPPNGETIIWEGASLFSFSTHFNPLYQTDSVPKRGHEMGKWTSKQTYIKNIHINTPYFQVARKEKDKNDSPKHSKCIVS